MGLDQPLEQAIAQREEFLAAVQRLPDAEQGNLVAEDMHEAIDGCVDTLILVQHEGNGVALYPLVDGRM